MAARIVPFVVVLFATAVFMPDAVGRTEALPRSALLWPGERMGVFLEDTSGVRGDLGGPVGRRLRDPGDTLWIFDADFEDLAGDNAGWFSLDMSGTLAKTNYWHKDTIRTGGFEHLGDSTWWCGTYNDCWVQSQGYGNDWVCSLTRGFPLSTWSSAGDQVTFEWDQRFAMEKDYDYGYVDVSTDGGSTWVTELVQTNPGFAGKPGFSQDWDSPQHGHRVLEFTEYAGLDLVLRFRFESDSVYSSQDQGDNFAHTCLDGAWQVDNTTWTVNDSTVWLDDCESPGDNGWAHDDLPVSGQTGVVYRRVFEPYTFRPGCWSQLNGWWMAAVDSVSGRTVDGENAWLISPPIDISGADALLGAWLAWVDASRPSNNIWHVYVSSGDDRDCVQDLDSFQDPEPGSWIDYPHWYRDVHNWSDFAGKDWLAINWRLWNYAPAEPGYHMTGFMLGRQRVGIPVGGSPTEWRRDPWNSFHDTYDIGEALADTAIIQIRDNDGIADALLVSSSDRGATWEASPMILRHPQGDYWLAPSPVGQISESTEIWYYFEATDGTGDVRTHPWNAPDAYYEFSVLPIVGSVSDPAILLVDKHGRTTPGEDREHRCTSEDYYREMLDILGYEYDVYDTQVPSGMPPYGNGPDTAGMKFYDTQVWFTNRFDAHAVTRRDQSNLVAWLSESAAGTERNLLLTGNDIGKELMEVGTETLGFYTVWLASEYLGNRPGTTSDTMPGLRDAAGAFDFMTHDDGKCFLWDDG